MDTDKNYNYVLLWYDGDTTDAMGSFVSKKDAGLFRDGMNIPKSDAIIAGLPSVPKLLSLFSQGYRIWRVELCIKQDGTYDIAKVDCRPTTFTCRAFQGLSTQGVEIILYFPAQDASHATEIAKTFISCYKGRAKNITLYASELEAHPNASGSELLEQVLKTFNIYIDAIDF